MNDPEFLGYVYLYAEGVKEGPLTSDERAAIVERFNEAEGTAAERAQRAVEAAIGTRRYRIDEMRKSANLDNTLRLLADVQAAAQQWQATRKK